MKQKNNVAQISQTNPAKPLKITVLPGDGIGREIIQPALAILQAVRDKNAPPWEFTEYPIGGSAIDLTGEALPEETLAACRQADAVLLGAVGGPQWDHLPPAQRPEIGGLLRLRQELNLYANIRPIQIYPALRNATPLKETLIENVNIMVLRELTGGLYFGQRGRRTISASNSLTSNTSSDTSANASPDIIEAFDTLTYTETQIERILRSAFAAAQQRNGKLCSVDKANVLESSRLWRETAERLAAEYPGVKLTHMYVDNCAMQIVRAPSQFDVIVTENMFGDILTDLASVIGGSIGTLASASMNGTYGLYEPAHGSAPDIAGQNIANPLAAILSAALMLRFSFGREGEASRIEQAVNTVLNDGLRTVDLIPSGIRQNEQRGGDLLSENAGSSVTKVGTREMGEAVLAALRKG